MNNLSILANMFCESNKNEIIDIYNKYKCLIKEILNV